MSCTLGPLVEEAKVAASGAYEICEADPSGLQLTADDLLITEESSWCKGVPTYTVQDVAGYLPTIVTQVKDIVYNELWANLQSEISTLATNAAMTYSTKLERVTGDTAMAGQLEASYAQWASSSSALASSVQTALASQNYALSQQILETKASLNDKITANSEFYQTSLASVGETMAASGVLNSVTLADGSKVVSGFRSQASSETGSEFTIFADTFKILNRVPNGSGGYDYSRVIAPFTVQNDTVYIGAVNTSEPQITYLGEFASAPSTAGLDKNVVYKNTTDGNSYRFNGTSWVVFLTKGATGATGPAGPAGSPGSNGTRGSVHITVNGTYSSGSATSSAFQSATGLYDKVIGDWVTFNSSGGATDYYRSGNYSDTWVNASLYVNGNLLVTGTVYANKIAANHIGSAVSTKNTGYITTTGTFGDAVSSGYQNVCSITYSNGANTPVKVLVTAMGRTGYVAGDSLNHGSVCMGIFQENTVIADNGWSPAYQDTKAFSAVTTIAANSSSTFYIKAAKASTDAALYTLSSNMSLSIIGVASGS